MEEKKIDFEKELNHLNEIVSKIQDEALPLDESIKLYEEGNKIIAMLEKELKDAQDKIEKIVSINKK
ncbi:MAG: exodeoxyribonuclease VII small subunit [Bacilli bacterium]|nr:exodeoxyribonuclease VII small subunit [Bacilli bacterium]